MRPPRLSITAVKRTDFSTTPFSFYLFDSHDELMSMDGTYADMWQQQLTETPDLPPDKCFKE